MNVTRPLTRLAITFLLFAAGTGIASAQATRTWVSGVGDDANPCSRTAPCKTFAGAISKTAAGGVIDVLDPGGFGAVTITKSITLENIGEIAGVLVSGTNGVIVNAAATDTVVLRGISFEGLGTGLSGVNFLNGGKLIVENCTIQKFATGINFTPAANASLVVQGSTINNNSSNGVLVQGGAATTATNVTATLDNVKLLNNGFGLQVTKGIASIKHSAVTGSNSVGVKALGNANLARITIDDSIISDAIVGTGVNAQGSQASIFLSRSTVTGNTTGISVSSGIGSITSFGNNRIVGNTGVDGNPTTTVAER